MYKDIQGEKIIQTLIFTKLPSAHAHEVSTRRNEGMLCRVYHRALGSNSDRIADGWTPSP